jgi:hypothetical protein
LGQVAGTGGPGIVFVTYTVVAVAPTTNTSNFFMMF